MRPTLLAFFGLLGLLGSLGLGCQDVGVVGEQPDCEPACAPGTFCMLDLLLCVECAQDQDCTSDRPFCEGFACVECRIADDCPMFDGDDDEDDQRTCEHGTCTLPEQGFDSTEESEHAGGFDADDP